MATKADKKNAIRQEIIDSAAIYSQSLASFEMGTNSLVLRGKSINS